MVKPKSARYKWIEKLANRHRAKPLVFYGYFIFLSAVICENLRPNYCYVNHSGD